MCISSVSFAQWDSVHEINDFSKLLSSHVNPYLIKEGASLEANNLRANDTYGALSKRSAMLSYGTVGSYAVTGLHRYYKSAGDKHLIVSGSTYLKGAKNDSSTFIILRDELTDGSRWQFVTFKNKAIGVNGADNPQKYDGKVLITDNTDGARTTSILTADLGAPYAELNTGANLDASRWYQYKMGYYDGSTYYYSTARSNPILTGATVRDISLTDIPLGPSGTTARYVYRTLGNTTRANAEADTAFWLVSTIADNTTTTLNDTMTDDTADNGATPLLATVVAGSNLTPPISKFIMIHKKRLWMAHNPTNESDVYWSYAFKPDIFDAADYEEFRPDDGDEITFIKNQLGVVVIGKTNSIIKFSTISSSDTLWSIHGPYSFVGCQAPYSAVNSPVGIIYLSKNGLYAFNGQSSSLISDAVTSELRDVLWTNRNNVAGVFHQNEYQMAYTSVESGEAVNNKVIVFDIQRDAYSIDDKSVNVFEVLDSGSDEGTLYSGTSDTDGYVHAHTFATSELVYRSKSDLKTGTMSSVGVLGTEVSPSMELSWGFGCDDAAVTGRTTDSVLFAGAITDRPSTSGWWWGPIVQINADVLDKLYWSESLGGFGDITLAVRFGASSAAVSAASWSSEYTNPAGSDISGITANDWAQIRATYTSTDINYTPTIWNAENYAIRLAYSKEGAIAETIIPTVWKKGWMNFGKQKKKRISEIEFFYEATEGDINFTLENLAGNISKTFEIDFTVDPDDDLEDGYTGNKASKSYLWRAPVEEDTPIGEFFQYTLEDDGITAWKIFKIKTRYSLENIY